MIKAIEGKVNMTGKGIDILEDYVLITHSIIQNFPEIDIEILIASAKAIPSEDVDTEKVEIRM